MRKNLAMIGLPLLLGGCGLPPALSAASWALDGISYLASGKSVTDHAISEVMQQDCALLRAVLDQDICADFGGEAGDGPRILVATATSYGDSWSVADGLTTLDDPFVVAADVAEFVEGFGPGTVVVSEDRSLAAFAPVAPKWVESTATSGRFDSATPKARPVYLNTPIYEVASARTPRLQSAGIVSAAARAMSVVGSFQSIDNARKQAERFAALGAEVRSMRIDGRTWHRVVVDAPLAKVQNMGAVDAWVLRVCNTNGTLPPCGPVTLASTGFAAPQVARTN